MGATVAKGLGHSNRGGIQCARLDAEDQPRERRRARPRTRPRTTPLPLPPPPDPHQPLHRPQMLLPTLRLSFDLSPLHPI